MCFLLASAQTDTTEEASKNVLYFLPDSLKALVAVSLWCTHKEELVGEFSAVMNLIRQCSRLKYALYLQGLRGQSRQQLSLPTLPGPRPQG